jgi:putative ABC transport system permease protein
MRSQFRHIYRSFREKPVFSSIVFIGFTIGILASLLIYLWIYNELNYDKFHPGYQNIYRVLTLAKQGNEVVKSPGCYRPVAKTLKADYSQVRNATYISFDSEYSPLRTESGGNKIEALRAFTDDDFFKIFQGFTFLEGSRESAFKNPRDIVLSEKVAQKLFGDQHAIGKSLISDKYSTEVYTVSGVVKIPAQSHIDFGFLILGNNSQMPEFSSKWNDKYFNHVYIKLENNAVIDNTFIHQVTNQISHYSGMTDKLLFQPLADIHLHSDYQLSRFDKNIGNIKYVWIFSGLALLIIIMASLNFSILSVARASERTTEIGIKKVNGASHLQIVQMFLCESVIITILATIAAFLIAGLILPLFIKLAGKEIIFHLSVKFVLGILCLTFLTGIISGIYPSIVLSAFKPSGILKGGFLKQSNNRFISSLVTVQFSISIFLIIATLLFIKQLSFIRSKDLGFNHQDVVVIPTGLWYDNQSFKDELLRNPNILSVSASTEAPLNFGWKTQLVYEHEGKVDSLQASIFCVDQDFDKTYQLEVTKGCFLQTTYSDYWKKKTGNTNDQDPQISIPVVINETAEKMLGFTDPIGQRLGNNEIVGVVKDFNFQTLYHPIGPIMLTNNPENMMAMNIKVTGQDPSETLNFIRNTYRKYRDQRDFSYHFFDDLISVEYQSEAQLKNMTLVFSVLAIIISFLGIFGMAWFSTGHRTKEIGIRKVNGAQVSEIFVLINRDFFKWIGFAFMIAIPVSFYYMHNWLNNFAYKTNLSWWIFVLSGIIVLGIALLAVSYQSWRAATRNPVEALRYE